VDFFGINGWEMLVLLLLAMFIFGPDRLPKAISDGVRMARNLMDLARNATTDLSRELGTDIALEDLNPKALLRKHLLSEDDERALRAPIEELYHGVRKDITGAKSDVSKAVRDLDPRAKPVSNGGPTDQPKPRAISQAFDTDAT
jgi:sec-independent protein translocase protein TatB